MNNKFKIIKIAFIIILILSFFIFYYIFFRYKFFYKKKFFYKYNKFIFFNTNNLIFLFKKKTKFSKKKNLKYNKFNNTKKYIINSLSILKNKIIKITYYDNYYYIILGSFINKELALKYTNFFLKKGIHALVLKFKKKHLFRISISKSDMYNNINYRSKKLKKIYGKNIWVLKN